MSLSSYFFFSYEESIFYSKHQTENKVKLVSNLKFIKKFREKNIIIQRKIGLIFICGCIFYVSTYSSSSFFFSFDKILLKNKK